MGHVFEGGEVCGCVIGSEAAFVVAKDHVHNPVQPVLDLPMASDRRPDLVGEPGEGRDIEAGLALDLVGDFPGAFDHDDALQLRPVVAFFEPGDVVDGGVASGFDAAVIAIDRLVAADLGILEVIGFLLGHEQLDIGDI